MTREEQIDQAAWKYDRKNPSPGSEDYIVEGFIAGVNWADAHPLWHKWPDEEPPVTAEEFDIPVLVYLKDGYMTVGMRNDYSETAELSWEIYSPAGITEVSSNEIIAWIELPEPPKFD